MIRLFFTAYFYLVKFMFGFLGQFTWFQAYLGWVQWAAIQLAKAWLWWVALCIVCWLFWGDVLSLVGLVLLTWNVYRWRHREAW